MLKYKWLGFAIMLIAAVSGLTVGALAYYEKISIQSAHTFVLWCVAIGLSGWVWQILVIIRLRDNKNQDNN